MTTFERAAHGVRPIDVAAMPAYKLLALGVGTAVFVVALLLVASLSTAVLSAAAVASMVWLTGSFIH
ncbi:hypothetical protein BKG83_22115 [Mycobacteroides chelonae]|jgi:hypothetical protein|uniref:hypothetical protein n=1 Tax=Mycobacteroides chelonae TaxID=1774 RepID=UPI0008A9988D|nr:hypothetical protein [Mycobacteroides chelonae]PKQ58556.1 hypothetical protein B5566_06850 [Mycobacterium sp. MHSD3]SKL79269.1 Uncharacterised protein [Mycobacteroides abscessus subsp. bolletii]MBF9521717.1 hypothetical protein [Mycobacteroides chelonae]MBV0916620.1 hypothetical protein [Mycobacteroides chelonae]OHU28465.1 hypothetical protein BKG77_02790 [Mycobacteroides chelonae]